MFMCLCSQHQSHLLQSGRHNAHTHLACCGAALLFCRMLQHVGVSSALIHHVLQLDHQELPCMHISAPTDTERGLGIQ